MSLGITQTNNEIKNVIKVIRFLENRGILLERTTEKEGGFLSKFLGTLMKFGLPLMKNVLTPLAITVRIAGSSISNRCSYSKGST